MVKDTRQLKEFTTRRRYECANGHRFWTLEQVDVSKTPIRQKQKAT
jgi:transcriptional regulator NrdR family protein